MKNIVCKIRGHNLDHTNKLSRLTVEYACTNCNQKFTTDGYGQIVKLNSFWKENNLLFEKIILGNNAQGS